MEAVFDLQRLDDAIDCLQSSQQMKMQAVSHLDIARELTGQGLPTFEWGEDVEAVRERAGLPPEVDMGDLDNLRDRLESLVDLPDEQDDAQEAVEAQVSESAEVLVADESDTQSREAEDEVNEQLESLVDLPDSQGLGVQETQASAISEVAQADELDSDPQSPQTTDTSQQVARIGAWKQQSGRAEKYVGKFLNDSGLAEAVMADEQFYLRIDNQPYQPLSVERQGNQLMLTHYAQQGGDKFIDK